MYAHVARPTTPLAGVLGEPCGQHPRGMDRQTGLPPPGGGTVGRGKGETPLQPARCGARRSQGDIPGRILPMTPTKSGVRRGGLRDDEPSGSPIASPAVAGTGRTQGEHWSDPSRPHPKRVDVIDRQILEILQHNSQATYDDIAARIRRSASTTRDRIRQMERSGIIRGYCAIIDAKAVGLGTEALIFCNLPSDREEEVLADCLSLRPVIRVFHVSGERRTVLRVAVPDNRALWRFITTDLKRLGIIDVDAKVILDSRERFPPDLLPTSDVPLPLVRLGPQE